MIILSEYTKYYAYTVRFIVDWAKNKSSYQVYWNDLLRGESHIGNFKDGEFHKIQPALNELKEELEKAVKASQRGESK